MRSQFLALVTSRGLASLLFVATNILTARWAGPAVFGSMSVVIGAATFAFVLADVGLSSYVSRAEAQGERAEVAGALRLNAVTSALGAVVCVLATLAFAAAVGGGPWLIAIPLWLALDKNSDTALSVFIARRDKLTPAVSIVLRRSVGLAAVVLLHLLGLDAVGAFALGMTISGVVGQSHIRLSLRGAALSLPTPMRLVLRRTVPFLISNVSASARNLDVVLVGGLGGHVSAGLYAGVQRLVSPFMLIPGTVSALVLPSASRRSGGGAARIAGRLTALHLGLTALLALVALFAQPIVVGLLGPRFAPGAAVLVWQLLAFPFVALSSPLGGVLQSQGFEREVARNGVLFVVVLLPAIAVGVLLYGAAGAAAALLFTYLAKCAVLVLLVRRLLGSPRNLPAVVRRARVSP